MAVYVRCMEGVPSNVYNIELMRFTMSALWGVGSTVHVMLALWGGEFRSTCNVSSSVGGPQHM